MALGPNATARDQWEYNRQAALIAHIDAELAKNAYEEGVPLETATRRRAEAVAVQNYLIETTHAARDVDAGITDADAQWREQNPPPPIENAEEFDP